MFSLPNFDFCFGNIVSSFDPPRNNVVLLASVSVYIPHSIPLFIPLVNASHKIFLRLGMFGKQCFHSNVPCFYA